MLIAEDLLLLLTDDASGRLSVSTTQADAALAGANLIELTLLHRVDLTGEHDTGKPGRLIVRDPSLAGDEILDAALQTIITHQGRKPAAVIRPLGNGLRPMLYERLASRGVLHAETGRVLGVFPVHRWPAQDASHEAQLRGLLTDALVQRAMPDARSAALIALAHALRCEHKIIEPGQAGLSRRELRARAAQVASGNWASAAVRKVIDEMAAAVVATVSASAAAGAG